MSRRYYLLSISLVIGIIWFSLPTQTALAQACVNNGGCAAGQICDYETGSPTYRNCASLEISFAQNGLTATGVTGVITQNGIGSMTVYGCLGRQTTCATQPVSNTQYWQNLGTGAGNQTVTFGGLRPNRTYVVTFQGVSNGDSALAESAPFTTLPGGPITPTVSNIGDSSATVSWGTASPAQSLLLYGIAQPRWETDSINLLPADEIASVATSNFGNSILVTRLADIWRKVGTIWTTQSNPDVAKRRLRSVDSLQNNLWVVGDAGLILRSVDNGNAWTVTNPPTGFSTDLLAVTQTSSTTAWAVGQHQKALFFDGVNWNDKLVQSAQLNQPFLGVSSINNKQAWVVGSAGTIAQTSDGGTTWTKQALPGTSGTTMVYAVSTLDGGTLYAGGSGPSLGSTGRIWKSTNGGATWAETNTGRLGSISAIYQYGNNEFWFNQGSTVGRYINGNVIYFDSQTSPFSGVLVSMSGSFSESAFAVGEDKIFQYGKCYFDLSCANPISNFGSVTNHSIGLSGLAPNTQYYVIAQSKDSANQITYGGQTPFTTTSPDFIPPTISITDPASGTAFTRNNTYVIRGTISDNLRLSSLTCEDVTNHVVVSPALITVTPTLPISGTDVTATWAVDVYLGTADVSLQFTCTVSDGNAARNQSASATIVRDTVAPVVDIAVPEPFSATIYTGNPMAINGNVADANALARMEYVLNGGAPVTFTPPGVSGPWSTTMTGMITGSNDLTVYAYDGAGNRGVARQSFEYATPTFDLTVSPTPQTISAGQSAAYTATVTPQFGFTGAVNFSLSGNPAGSSVVPAPNPLAIGGAPASSTLTVQTAAAPTGTFPMTVTATGGGVTKTFPIVLTIIAPPDFSITTSPSNRSVQAGNGTTYNLSVIANPTFAGTVDTFALQTSPSGVLPAGVAGTFTPGSVTLAGGQNQPVILSVATTLATPSGTYTLRVTGTDRAKTITRFVDLTLVVIQPPDVTLSVLPNTVTITAGSGTAANYNGKATAANGYNRLSTLTGSVGATIAGLDISITPSAFTPATGPLGTDFVVTATADSRVPGGTYTLTVTLRADDASLTKTAAVQLVIIADTTLPIISITQADVAANFDRATVAWRTNKPANSRLEVYSDPARATLVGILGDPAYVTTRSLVYVGLNPVTTYYLRVTSTDEVPVPNAASRITFDDGSPLLLTTLDAPDISPPRITITQPRDGDTVIGTIMISGTATDEKEVRTVLIRVLRPDGSEAMTQTFTTSGLAFTYYASWNTLTGRINGLHTITARATDGAGNFSPVASITVNVANDLTKPVVEAGYPEAVNLQCGAPVSPDPNKCQITVHWFTDDPSTTVVEYAREDTYFASGYGVTVDRDDSGFCSTNGTTPCTTDGECGTGSCDRLSPSAPLYREHRVTLTNLDRNYLYHYRITSCNISGDCTN